MCDVLLAKHHMQIMLLEDLREIMYEQVQKSERMQLYSILTHIALLWGLPNSAQITRLRVNRKLSHLNLNSPSIQRCWWDIYSQISETSSTTAQ